MSPYRWTRFAPLAFVAAVAVACDDDETTGPDDQPAQLRIVNATDIQNVEVRRVGSATPLAQDLEAYAASESCFEVPAGEHAFVFSATGVELAVAAGEFEEGGDYTAVLDVSGGARRAAILSDNEAATTGNNALRMINATATIGDVYVTPPGTAAGAAFRVAGGISPFAVTNANPSYAHRAVEHTEVQLYDVDVTTGTPRAELTLTDLPPSRKATVVLTDPGTSSFIAAPCP